MPSPPAAPTRLLPPVPEGGRFMLDPPEVVGDDGTSRGPVGAEPGVRCAAELLGRLDFGTAEATGIAPPLVDGLTTTPPGVPG
jgi:hypothetical protein